MRDTRQHVIVQLLERMPDLLDPVRSGNGGTMNGMLLMPHATDCAFPRTSPPRCTCALRSVLELERLLHVMHDSRDAPLVTLPDGGRVSLRALWWHLSERYLRCQTNVRDVTWRAGRWQGLSHGTVVAQPGGWQLTRMSESPRQRKRGVAVRVRVVTWNPGVQPAKVERGVGWLADNWGLQAEPMLPREVIAA